MYVITHEEHEAGKIGITGLTTRTDRLAAHERNGWTRHEDKLYRVETGTEARRIEQAVMKILRDVYGIPPFLTRREMPNGWTETFDLQEVRAIEVWRLVQDTACSRR